MSIRLSPIRMELPPHEVMQWRGWQVVSTYLGENPHSPLFVTDLSHIPKVAIQSHHRAHHLDGMRPMQSTVPGRPGEVTLEKRIMIARLTPLECRLMALDETGAMPQGAEYTDMTDAFATLALVGPQCMEVLSRLSPVDLEGPGKTPPCAALAPLEGVTCLFIYLKGRRRIPGLIVSVERGYGQFLFRAFTDAGKAWDLTPAGWQRFREWLP